MKENSFYNQLSRQTRSIEIPPESDSWEVLESQLDEYNSRKKVQWRMIVALAASVFGFLFYYVLFNQTNQQSVILEGPLSEITAESKTPFLNTAPNIRYDRLKDYDRRVDSKIQVVKNVNMHYKYADIVEAATRPHAFHPEDFVSEVDYWRHYETKIDAQRLSGNWYLHHAEIPFNKILKLETLDRINWIISSEVVEGPQKFLRIPGQQKYFVKQQNDDELVIIEILDYTTIIMKKFDVANNRFEEAIYQKRDIG
jgi:hypothetical protein